LSAHEEKQSRTTIKRFLTVEIPLLAIVSALTTLLPIVPWPYWLTLAALGTGLGFVWAWRGRFRTHLPIDVFDEMETDQGVVLEVPGSHDMLVAANSHVKHVYGHDSLSLAEVERWWGRNPWVFAALRSASGEYLGYFDVLPLTEDGVRLIESGSFDEKDIGAHHILPPTKMKGAKKLYLSGIAVRDQGTDVGKARAASAIWGLAAYVRRYYGDKPRRVIAVAATDDGERLLKGIGAKVFQDRHSRKDKHDLYEFMTEPDLISSVKHRASKRSKPPKLSFKLPR
jgi:hypothetical protein